MDSMPYGVKSITAPTLVVAEAVWDDAVYAPCSCPDRRDLTATPTALKLPLEMGVLSFVQNVDKELRNGGKASTCGIHAGI